MKPPTPVVNPTAPQTLLRSMTLEISSAQESIAGEILAYTEANDEGRDLNRVCGAVGFTTGVGGFIGSCLLSFVLTPSEKCTEFGCRSNPMNFFAVHL